MTEILSGVRILEVAEHTFVPAASAVLADLGAEVIKIEHVTRGDAMRGLTVEDEDKRRMTEILAKYADREPNGGDERPLGEALPLDEHEHDDQPDEQRISLKGRSGLIATGSGGQRSEPASDGAWGRSSKARGCAADEPFPAFSMRCAVKDSEVYPLGTSIQT